MSNSKTKVVSVKVAELRKIGISSFEEWAKNPDHVYIARNMSFYVPGTFQSKWHNPFKVGKCGTVEEVVEKYKQHVLRTPALFNSLPELRGKVLGCWCKPNFCHGDILVELLETYFPTGSSEIEGIEGVDYIEI